VGYLTSDNTDTFISSATVPSGYNAAVKFTVRNAGTNVSGNWVFNANLPTNSSYTYNSNSQQSLRPGERIDFTLGFDRAQNGVRTITVTVDPNNQISESSEGNNSAAHVISVN
jgi:subtilase family serine protease